MTSTHTSDSPDTPTFTSYVSTPGGASASPLSDTDDSKTAQGTHMDIEEQAYPDILIFKGTRFPFDPHKVVYTSPKKTSHGGYLVQCMYEVEGNLADGTPVSQSVPIVLQTPEMVTTFGMSAKEHDGGKIRGTVDVAFRDNAGQDVSAFHDVMKLWDRLVLEKAKSEKATWFKSSKITDEILDYLYNPMVRKNIRKSDGKEFSDSFRSKIPRRYERFDCEAYDDQARPIPLSDITRMATIRKLCRHTGVWFSDTMFVSSFEALQIQKMQDGKMQGYSFV